MLKLNPTSRSRGERFMRTPTAPTQHCPNCQSATESHGFWTPDGLWLATHYCPTHGPVCPVPGPAREEHP